MTRRLLVSAGEASGDRLAGAVIEALGEDWRVEGMGGDAVEGAGGRPWRHAREVSVMGLVEVLPALPRVWGVGREVLRRAKAWRPDVALLVDLPDFNMRLGPRLAAMGVPVVYLGAPQAWAWRPGRAAKMAPWVSSLACLFPFEPAFFEARGVRSVFVGHPRSVDAARLRGEGGDDIVLMPGSRQGELRRHLPALRGLLPHLARRYPSRRRLIPVAPTLRRAEVIEGLGEAASLVEVVERDALEVLSGAAVAVVASGTAVTECALMGVPPVVFYRVNPLSYQIAKRWIQVEHVGMVNLLAGERLAPELLQDEVTPAALLSAVSGWLDDPAALAKARARLGELARGLEGPEDGQTPAGRVAAMVRRAR